MENILTKNELTDIITKESNVICKFSAPWCQPCKVLGGIIEDIEKENNNVVFVGVNIDESEEDLITEFGIRSVPVLIFFKDGFQVDKTIGMIGREKITEKINEHYGK